jgi:hypothetical protein
VSAVLAGTGNDHGLGMTVEEVTHVGAVVLDDDLGTPAELLARDGAYTALAA